MNCRAQMVSVCKCSEFTLEGWILSLYTQEKEKECPLTPPVFSVVLDILASAIRQAKEIKSDPNWKEIIKAVLFMSDMIFYVDNLVESPKRILELINEFNKLQYTKSIYKNQFYFYTLASNTWKSKHFK